MLDGEVKVNPVVYGRRGGARTVNPARMRLCMDFEPVHFNRANRLYADGHVVAAMQVSHHRKASLLRTLCRC